MAHDTSEPRSADPVDAVELTIRLPADVYSALEHAVGADGRAADQIVVTALRLHLRDLERTRDLMEALAGDGSEDDRSRDGR